MTFFRTKRHWKRQIKWERSRTNLEFHFYVYYNYYITIITITTRAVNDLNTFKAASCYFRNRRF
jgi:hypothetical protein